MRVELLQVEPTTRCNFTCGFCAGRHMDQSDLDVESFDRVLEAFPDVRHLELQGEGEPLMHTGFFEMAKRAAARGVEVSTITNGSFFTARNIERLFDADLRSLLVSIESPDEEEFRHIRGGRLDRVVAGIRALVAARRTHGRQRPSVGFAVTVLRSTRDRLPAILDLYESLGMDGGILVHMLSPMGVYAQNYDPAMHEQVIPKLDQALAWSRYARLLERRGGQASRVQHFWAELFGHDVGARAPGRPPTLERCPWLDRGLFVDRLGYYTACPNVKDGARFGFGRVGDPVGAVLAARHGLAERVSRGDVPEPCRGCFIAESIAQRAGTEPEERNAHG